MYPVASVYLVIVLAFVLATIPFLTERMFAFVPLALKGEPVRFTGYYFLRAVVFYGLVIFATYLVAKHSGLHYQLLGFALFLVLLYVPGLLIKPYVKRKNIGVHAVELFVFYALTGCIGFMIESSYANSVAQPWPFYAISLSLFAVLAFPGFVWRHLAGGRRAR